MSESQHRIYPLSIKLAIAKSRNQALFPKLRIPRNTAVNWRRMGVRVPDGDGHALEVADLITKIAYLEGQLALAQKVVESMRQGL